MIAEEDIRSKQKQIKYQTTNWTIEQLIVDINLGKINVPREWCWDINKQSQVIENIILGVPFSALFVLDNLEILEINASIQLAKTLINFVENKFCLIGMTRLSSLNGFKFMDLNPQRQIMFKKTLIRVIIVDKQSNLALFEDS
jgi:hypothetical protein